MPHNMKQNVITVIVPQFLLSLIPELQHYFLEMGIIEMDETKINFHFKMRKIPFLPKNHFLPIRMSWLQPLISDDDMQSN
jgi:hypothetical protein